MLGEIIAEGKWSRIHSASPINSELSRAYVAKIAKSDCKSPRLANLMLEREFIVTQAVRHPNLVTVLDASLEEAPGFLIQPYLGDITLEGLIKNRVQPSLPFAIWIGRQIADALCALHKYDVIHSDISPQNIVINNEGHATLIDLGLSRVKTETSLRSSVDELMVGTVRYMAPNILNADSPIQTSADIFSLGMIVCELLSPKGFPQLETGKEMTRLDIRQALANVPKKVVQLLESMTERDNQNRPESAEVAERLLRLEVEHFADRF